MARLRRTNPRGSVNRGARSRGVALVAVLLLVAGLIAIATAVVTLSASQRRAAQRAYEADARREILDGALRVALAEISFGKAQGPYWHPRQPRIVKVGEKRVEVTLEREVGRIDLNTAEEKYLVAALVVAGMSEADARTGTARVQDWIDADDKAAPNGGAEREEYRSAGLAYEPRNAPMETVEEVRQIMGLRALSDADLEPFTVYSQQREPFAGEASPATRRVLETFGQQAAPPPAPPNSNDPVSYGGAVIRLHACEEGMKEVCREVVVRVTGSAREPWQTMSWK
jgi:type II secretory pathway component PulK